MNRTITAKQQLVADIINRNSHRIMMLCRGYCDNREDLEDLFQEVSIKIWNGIDSFRGEAEESTWVYRVTLNTAINFKRHKSRRITTVPILDHDTIDASMEPDKRTGQLYALLMKLDVVDRALIMLWLENLTYEEIGLVMGLSAKNVSVKLVRIKEKLKQLSKTC